MVVTTIFQYKLLPTPAILCLRSKQILGWQVKVIESFLISFTDVKHYVVLFLVY